MLRTSGTSAEAAPQLGRYREIEAVEVMEMKAVELLGSMQSTECFSFLGQESVQSLFDLYVLHTTRLAKEKDYSRVIR